MTCRGRGRVPLATVALALLLSLGSVTAARAQQSNRSLANAEAAWPRAEQWWRVLLLRDYNTRVVVFSTTLLGCAAGMVGSYALLRKRALLGDALSHATLPGIGVAFLIGSTWGGGGKSLPWLLCGATASGLLGIGTILAIRQATRLKDDAAMGIVLSVFFGAGVAVLGLVQQMPQGHAAGLEAFILGKTAAMGMRDAWFIAVAAVVSIGLSLLYFKELTLLCFDEAFAAAQGMPVRGLDWILMSLLILVTIVGLQAVGLILMIALLVIPPAAARFWTDSARRLLWVAGGIGAVGGMLGALVSGLFSRLPSGPIIVLVCAGLFLLSLLFGRARGVLVRAVVRLQLNRRIERQHLLRALYESVENRGEATSSAAPGASFEPTDWVKRERLLAKRSWSTVRLARAIRQAVREGLVEELDTAVRLTRRGLVEGARRTREHRLWELYLIRHADIAASQVDRDADAIEHVLQPEVVAELAALLEHPQDLVPASPHALGVRGDLSAHQHSPGA